MAKRAAAEKTQRQGRRGAQTQRRVAPERPPKTHVDTSLGELIAAAFDTLGNEVADVAKLLSSRELRRCAGQRIVLVQ
jgi:hypothetical protein